MILLRQINRMARIIGISLQDNLSFHDKALSCCVTPRPIRARAEPGQLDPHPRAPCRAAGGVAEGARAATPTQQAAAPSAAATSQGAAPNPERNAYFGELHLHTSWSFDAYSFQNTVVDPDAAYRFAKGEAIRHMNGEMVKRNTPLDFAAVTDHAEYLGVAQLLTDADHPLYQKPVAAKFRSKDPKEGKEAYLELAGAIAGRASQTPIWSIRRSSDRSGSASRSSPRQHNAPGKFTTFIAFEWTSTPDNANLHRNVIFGGTVVPELPFSSMESTRPEDLWAYVERARAAGSDVIAIPHNANISNGLMFQTTDSDGKAFTREYAQRRLDMEPLQEIIQLKGASETAPSLAPNDEFADFELYQFQLGTGKKLPEQRTSFVREAYKSGLVLGATLGVNPFKFGLVGASDSHNGTAAPEENNFSGGHGAMDKDPTARLTVKDPLADKTKFSASGLTGVWAEENTRESIFAAFKRKETFGTSGTFIRARLFGGWSYAAEPHGVAGLGREGLCGWCPDG